MTSKKKGFGWEYIQERHPDAAKKILTEYHKREGFLPYEQGYVYLIHAVGTNYYKIGKSINPDKRILQIAPQMPFPVRCIHLWRSNFMSMAEARLHRLCRDSRANGEWFSFTTPNLSCLLSADIRDIVLNTYVENIIDCFSSAELDVLVEDFGVYRKTVDELGIISERENVTNLFLTRRTAGEAIPVVEILFSDIQKSLSPGVPADIKQAIEDWYGDDVINRWFGQEVPENV